MQTANPVTQEEYESIQQRHIEDIIALERKYENMYSPLLAKRCDVISGRIDPAITRAQLEERARKTAELEAAKTAERLARFEASKRSGGDSVTEDGSIPPPSKQLLLDDESIDSAKQVVGVPGFWLQAMRNNQVCVQV